MPRLHTRRSWLHLHRVATQGIGVGSDLTFGAGGYVEGSIDQSGRIDGGGGAGFGPGGGCSSTINYTF
jgi:hypothetical protein